MITTHIRISVKAKRWIIAHSKPGQTTAQKINELLFGDPKDENKKGEIDAKKLSQ